MVFFENVTDKKDERSIMTSSFLSIKGKLAWLVNRDSSLSLLGELTPVRSMLPTLFILLSLRETKKQDNSLLGREVSLMLERVLW